MVEVLLHNVASSFLILNQKIYCEYHIFFVSHFCVCGMCKLEICINVYNVYVFQKFLVKRYYKSIPIIIL